MVKARHLGVKGSEGDFPYAAYAASNADLLFWVNGLSRHSRFLLKYERAFGPMDAEMADRVLRMFVHLGISLNINSDRLEWPDSR